MALPEDMEMEVLMRLPVKSILRFRAVCRRWAALLSSDEFSAARTRLAESTKTELAAQLLFLHLPRWKPKRSTVVRSGDGRPLLTLDGVREHTAAMATCRGLTLVRDIQYSGRFHVFNAATRAAAMLPPPPSCQDNKDGPFLSTAGLGFDDRAKVHKVVRLFEFHCGPIWSEDRFTTIKCELYTLGRGPDTRCRWRPPSSAATDGGVVPSTLAGAALHTAAAENLAPVFAGGFLHWLVDPTQGQAGESDAATSMPAAPAVLSFSVADETFSSWVRPPPFNWDEGTHLTEIDGRLCMVRDLRRNSGLLEIWNYSNGHDCWSLEHRIDWAALHAGRKDLTEEPWHVRVVGGSVGKRKVIYIATSKCKVVAYDPKSATLETILVFGGRTSLLYNFSGSFTKVSLFKDSLTPVY